LSPVEQLYALVTVCTVVEQTLQCIKQPYECAASQNELETARVPWLLYQGKIDVADAIKSLSRIEQHSIH